MRFELVLDRLEPFPQQLPPAAPALVPVVLAGSGPRPGRSPSGTTGPRRAAVLVLIHPDERGDAAVVLTERATRGGHHSGEVSFPGGRVEPDDADDAATALREAREEVGLVPDGHVRVLGRLERFWIPVSDFEVTPIVATIDHRPTLVPFPDEVARIIHAPLTAFLPGAPLHLVEAEIGEWRLRYGAYPIDGLSVWGATARILSQLGAVVSGTVQSPG